MEKTELESRVKKIFHEQLGIEESAVTPEKHIDNDFGCDSLDHLELIMALEDEFEIEISDELAEPCKTVQQVYDAIAAHPMILT